MLFACALRIHPDKMCTDSKGWLHGLLSCLAQLHNKLTIKMPSGTHLSICKG